MKCDIAEAKDKFVRRYNSTRSLKKAAHDGLISALQRNRTYSPATRYWQRRDVRTAWISCITELAAKYQAPVALAVFESDIEVLQHEMNSRFSTLLCDGGFRISHAQKSLSVYLKHLWCIDEIVEPPACPVDRIILTIAGAPESLRTWTTVNTLDAYRHQLAILEKQASTFTS